MWRSDHSPAWAMLDALEEPTDGGRALQVRGFVLADPFDTFLRFISVEYLQTFWQRVSTALCAFDLDLPDLSWGIISCGTSIPGKSSSPKDFIGLTSRLLYTVSDENMDFINRQLPHESPELYCMALWRSLKWRIAPDDFEMALQLIEELCIDELTEWDPIKVLDSYPQAQDPWVKIARAIDSGDQQQLDQAAREAKGAYSPLGYRIVVRAYGLLLRDRTDLARLTFPSL